MAETVVCDMLLGLPGQLEQEFWSNARTLKTYTLMDYFAAVYTAMTALLAAKILWPALTNAQLHALCGHVLIIYMIIIVGGCIVCVTTAVVLVWWPQVYARHRHAIVVAHKFMWMGFCITITLMKDPKVQLALKNALSTKMVEQEIADSSASVAWEVAAQAVLGPYIILPVNIMSTSNWVMKMKWFLPSQIIHTLIIAHGAWSDMPCNVAADARLSQLLQPACEGMLQLQRMSLGLLVGPGFFKHNPDSYLACTGIVNSSQTLAWYQQVAYGLFVLCAGFGYLEWRLKTMFVQQHLGKRLVYRPWHYVSRSVATWPRSSSLSASAAESSASNLHGILTYGIAVPAGLSVLWFVSLWLVPRIPHDICDATCQDTGTCVPFKPCEGFWCNHPGMGVSLVVYLLMLLIAHAHSVTLFFM